MAFVVSEGALKASSAQLELPRTPRLMLGGLSQDYLEIWRKQYAVKTTVTFLARNVAQLGLPLYRRISDDERERLSDHPLAQLIRQPNPWTNRYRFLDAIVHDLAIFDLSYWLKAKGKADASGPGGLRLLRLPAAGVLPKGKNPFYPEYFEFRGTGGRFEFGADEVLFLRGYSGGMSDVGGVSPIESLREVLEESYWSSVGRAQVVRNGARVSGYLARPANTPWSDGAKESFRGDWQSQYTGYGPGAGGTPILEDGMTFVPASMTPKDLQYVESRRLTREETAAAYFIPPPMLGLLENATFSNITEQHLMLYQDTLGPLLSQIQDEIRLQLVPDFDKSDELYVEFNLADKLRGDFDKRQDAILRSVGAPYRTRNEGRALENLPPMDDPACDELVQPLNVTQTGDTEPIPAEPAPAPGAEPMMTPTPKPPPPPEEEPPKAGNARERRAIRRNGVILAGKG
jgi:HK97 family phage portal protein